MKIVTVIYGQLRVSCGLSATINATQPQDLKISPSETFAHWLDTQWLRLTNNQDQNNPLVSLCIVREYQWVAVLDYILLRRIRSSFLLCQGISPAALQTEVEFEDLNWAVLAPVFIKIIDRLNKMTKDWPIWHYDGKLTDPTENMKDDQFKKDSLKLIQNIKAFYEIYQSNLTMGLEADWKQAINSLVGFPEHVTPKAVETHLDYYKTNFELSGLLQTLGYVADHTYGMTYPKSVKQNSIVLINRPGHWVTENKDSRGVVLDSLTAGTDAIRTGDTFNYFQPVDNLKLMKKTLPRLAKIFPDVEIEIEDEGLTEFPELIIPETSDPRGKAKELNISAHEAYIQGDYKQALLDKRIECALREKLTDTLAYYENLLEFTEWCILREKPLTAKENLDTLNKIETSLSQGHTELRIKHRVLAARSFSFNEDNENAMNELSSALELCSQENNFELGYEVADSLGISYARLKKYANAIETFKKAKEFALFALENSADEVAENLQGPAKKYWPAIVKGLDNKLKELESTHEDQGIQKVA